MKKSLLLTGFLLSFILVSNAQTTVTTWYVIPPTSGCNGIWAVDALTYGPCSMGAVYNMSPAGCVQIAPTTVADTTYLPLCAFPCDLYMMNPQGGMCICGTGTTTDMVEQSSSHIVTTYPNPATTTDGWNIWLQPDAQTVTVNIYNTFGQLVLSQSAANRENIFHVNTSSLSAGTYFSEVIVNDAAPFRQMLVLSR